MNFRIITKNNEDDSKKGPSKNRFNSLGTYESHPTALEVKLLWFKSNES